MELKSEKLRAYNVRYKDDHILYTVGAKSRTQAIILCEDFINGGGDFIDYRATLARDKNKKPINTDHKGAFYGKEYIEHGIVWWNCPECGDEDFQYIDIEKYKCKKCGYEDSIPFIE